MKHMSSARRMRGLSAGTTAEERKAYLQTAEKLARYMQRDMLTELEYLDQKGIASARFLATTHARALNGMSHHSGLNPVLAVLREYRLTPDERKLLETTAADMQRRSLRGPARGTDVATYRRKVWDAIRDYGAAYELVQRMLEGGDDVCEKNECHVGGCFRVVNTGGFDAATMKLATNLMAEGARLVSVAGFPEVCYGDAYVTQRVSRENVLAFYMQDEDRMYVRAKPKKGEEALAVETIVHELGHRLHRKFGKGIEPKLRGVHADWGRRYARSPIDAAGYEPAVGETFEQGRRRYEVMAVGKPGPYQTVSYRRILADGSPDPKYLPSSMPATKFAMALGRGKRVDDPFPSPYAMTSPTELFAELFRVVVVGNATDEQRAAFRAIWETR